MRSPFASGVEAGAQEEAFRATGECSVVVGDIERGAIRFVQKPCHYRVNFRLPKTP